VNKIINEEIDTVELKEEEKKRRRKREKRRRRKRYRK